MYQSQEDSFLLLEQVKKYARGKVLDLGTGSGIQAMGAAEKEGVESVLAVDIDKKAIDELKKTIENPKIKFMVSDLFSGIFKKYDTIIFNPPYLPRGKSDEKMIRNAKRFCHAGKPCFPSIKDPALFGGKEGYEILEKFFGYAKNYLNDNGVILIVFSSFTQKEKVDGIIGKNSFYFEQLSTKHIFFEDLYVYLVKK
ncbi:MAG: methyltransferase [Nanoarchaeota archaeon]|nr:methyltransferase [Nanoarchaeota archaeon]